MRYWVWLALMVVVLGWGAPPTMAAVPLLQFFDGDNFALLQNGIKTKVTLACVGTPPLEAPGGRQARRALREALWGKPLSLRVLTKDVYGRLVAEVFTEENINRALVAQGIAHVDEPFRRECAAYLPP
ncbi:MAG: thermonuclease family protein [Pseudanabaenaceae cyanobacterium]